MVKTIKRNGLLDTLHHRGKLSKLDLERVESIQLETDQEDWEILLQLEMISEKDLRDAESTYCEFPVWEKKRNDKYPLLDKLPSNFLYSNKILPIGLFNGELDVAIAHPEDNTLVETIYYTARTRLNVKKVNLYVGCERDIQQGLDELYGAKEEKDETGNVGAGVEVTEDLQKLRDIASEAPLVRLVFDTIVRAIEIGASDIHIEMIERETRLRYRVDGMLRDYPAPPKVLYPAIISRIKIMAKLNIAEKRLPQDGRIRLPLAGKEIDIRVSLIPTIYGESVVLRILDRSSVCLELDKLGFHEDTISKFRALSRKADGMILVTGPTGSGKTTTLYSILQEIKSPDMRIVTVEDPVEYSVDGISQMQVHPQINLTFASALRNILRHDPDIILVGEIRDRETAEIALQASLTGHLVFSTLHTNNAAAAFTRLQDMGIESYLLSSCIIGVFAQRLVRTLCPSCKEEYKGKTPLVDTSERLFGPGGRAHLKKGNPGVLKTLYRAVGCDECMETGYRGRAAIGELLVVDGNIRQQIMAQKSSLAIARLAVSKGMKTLWQDGLEQVNAGVTSFEELTRVIDIEEKYVIE